MFVARQDSVWVIWSIEDQVGLKERLCLLQDKTVTGLYGLYKRIKWS